ncbi:unnamed protein product (macronuclear) [Paramecium tetraurelia]|uniref:CS domain-containing protein n=1 Tax=Paramecium tetraurelia TaxID=5888 RepID=A0BHG0_PARTE|nr:uncharacterized protein GSPATT00029012001 [Paramecium tetraurelia]CAK57977.1 unnamed protein product [Paramecium tetraurelia]|eukprot:XP_001425375.1 hypothetical protein (macronuclear) [Paramecium tetraurelia strain d4-2]
MLFLAFLISVSMASQDLLKKCYLEQFTIGDPEVKIQIYFEDHIVKNHQIEYECLEFIISRGYYKVALSLYENYFLLNHIDITDRIVAFLKNDKYRNQREMQTLFKLAMAKSNQVQVVQPVVQWAQSKNATFINIKFSHRQDAPACLNAKLEVVEIKNESLLIEAFGIVSHIPFKYRYAIKLYKPIDPTTSYEKVESVGTMYVNLTKVEPVLWLRLTEEDYKTPIWWDLKDNYRKDMEEFAQMLEKESERKERNADKQAKKNQKKRDQEKQKQTSQKALEAKRQLEYEHNQCYKPGKCEIGWYQRQ